ncbi:MAG TPA: hypothetical protein VFE15_07060 [Marmoricola sp.]|jgi:hypothetical protein|nr:hypothetical protein [Marmoricola sp.]
MIQFTKAKLSVVIVAAALLLIVILLQVFITRSSPSVADVPYSQNVQAVGEAKYVQTWTHYGPRLVSNFCPPRSPQCVVVENYLKVSRGTATVRVTSFKVTEKVKAYDYYLLDYDVTTSARSGTGDGGTGVFTVGSTGPALVDRDDSKAINATKSSCTTLAVGMSTPWPLVTASATIAHATLCDPGADLTRAYSGSTAVYHGKMLSQIHHLTMQRWVKVAAGAKPRFVIGLTLPRDHCTSVNSKKQCTKGAVGTTTKSIVLGTTG